MTTTQMIISLLTTIVSGGVLFTLFTIREKKLLEKLKVKQAEILTKNDEFEGYKDQIEFLIKRVSGLEYKDSEKEKKLFGMQRFITALISRKAFAELHFCSKGECLYREPPIGTFSTDDGAIEEILKTEK